MFRGFVHLHVHSEHSGLDSTARVPDIIAAAKDDGQQAIAITDHGTLAGIYTAVRAGAKAGVKVIPGIEAYLAIGSRHERNTIEVPADGAATDSGDQVQGNTKVKKYDHLTILATSAAGWSNLVAMHNASQHTMWGKHPRIDHDLLTEHAEGLVVLTGCLGGPVMGPLSRGDEPGAKEGIEALIDAVGKDNVYVEVMEHGIAQETRTLPKLAKLAEAYDLPLIATNDSHHVHADGARAHEAWLAMQTQKTLADPTPPRFAFDGTGYHVRTEKEMRAVRTEKWWAKACDNTVKLAERVSGDLMPGHYLRLPKFPVPEGFADSRAYLIHLVKEGAKQRWGDPYPKEVAQRLNTELKVYAELGVIDYSLIVHELITWARSRGIRVGPGRGCLTGDDLVWTPGGYKALRDVRIGDTVRTHTGALRQVANTMRYECDEPLVRIETSGHGNTMTADHKVLRIGDGGRREWVAASQVAVGDQLVHVSEDGQASAEVTSVMRTPHAGEIFDIEVPVDHSYMTDSYVVHNSSAGSAVSYALGIVGVDPLRFDLLFERFLDPTRVGMPDIDIDFEKGRRDEVLAHLVDMYGEDFVARIGTFQVSKTKASLKSAARVLSHPASLGDRLSKVVPMKGAEAFAFAELDAQRDKAGAGFWEVVDSDSRAEEVVDLARQFENVTTGPSIHACGTVVSDVPLTDLIPMRKDNGKDSSPDDPLVTEWDAGGVDDGIGLLKLDVLGLRTMDIVSAAANTVEELTGEHIDIDNLPDGDDLDNERVAKTWQLISSGRTAGLFQLESRSMTELAQDVAPSSMEHLAALVALFRPGPLSADMHTRYAARKNGREKVDYGIFTNNPAEQEQIARVLDATSGVAVYQEQYMLLGDVVAGFGPAERNRLRKAVSKKDPGEVNAVGELFIAGATSDVTSDGSAKFAFSPRTANKVWDAIKGGADYVFNKCLTADTVVQTGGRDVTYTIAELYRRLHGQGRGPGDTCPRCHKRPARPASEGERCAACASWLFKFNDPERGLSLLAVDAKDGRIRPQRVADVHFNGHHQVYRVTLADGRTVRATGNHRFMAHDQTYITVDDMIPGHTVLSVDGGVEPQQHQPGDYRLTRGPRRGVGRVYTPGKENIGYVDGGSGALKAWTRQTIGTASCDECNMTRSERRLERARLDGDRTNNSPSNLHWKCVSHHKAHDYRHNGRRRRFEKGRLRAASLVVSIVADGVEPVYDVEMAQGTDHNFLANGIVSHNSHAVAYGQLAYVTAFLKANWRAAYGAAVLSHTDDDDKRAHALNSLVGEGITVLPPEVNSAQVSTTALDADTVVLGLQEVSGVGKAAIHILAERDKNGPFTSATDILKRTRMPGNESGQHSRLTVTTVEALIEAGALDEFGPRKGQARALRGMSGRSEVTVPGDEWGEVERAVRQHGRLGLSLGQHPMRVLSDQVRGWNPDLHDDHGNPIGSKPMPLHKVLASGKTDVVTIGLVTGWKVKADNRGGQRADLRLEGSRGRIEAVVWNNTLRSLRKQAREVGVGSVVGVHARVRSREIDHQDEVGNTITTTMHSLTVVNMWPIEYTDTGATTADPGLGVDLAAHLFHPDRAAATIAPVPTESGGEPATTGSTQKATAPGKRRRPETSAQHHAKTIVTTAGKPPWRGMTHLKKNYPDMVGLPTDFLKPREHLRIYRLLPVQVGDDGRTGAPLHLVVVPKGADPKDPKWRQVHLPAHPDDEHWEEIPFSAWTVYVPGEQAALVAA
ncbi:PHP domain-containing protein [Pseudactinotalea sp. Z1748]|uniref:PHP domain-containing protein n=1 Tax=Pseudactinotalea sp. Z1748 TaxID=3413027 RepID=UPI003C7E53F5